MNTMIPVNPMKKTSYIPCPPTRQTGLSLVELMIALAIGLVLLLGLSTLMVQQNNTRNEMDKSSRQIENGRYAMQLLHDDIQLAGFYGEYSPANGIATAIPNDPCSSTLENLGWDSTKPQVPVAILGYTGGAGDPTPSKCLENYLDNTAILVIRRASSVTTPVASAAANTIYLQVSSCNTDAAAAPFVLGTSGYNLRQKDCATLAVLRPYIVRIYYISSCTVCGSDTIPTLKVREIIGGIASTIPLVEGIQNMQFDYGIDTSGDGAPDDYDNDPDAADWPNVMAVRINLLARNNDPTTNHKDTKTYGLGGAGTVGPFNDTLKRQAYSQLVRAVNPSGRRE